MNLEKVKDGYIALGTLYYFVEEYRSKNGLRLWRIHGYTSAGGTEWTATQQDLLAEDDALHACEYYKASLLQLVEKNRAGDRETYEGRMAAYDKRKAEIESTYVGKA